MIISHFSFCFNSFIHNNKNIELIFNQMYSDCVNSMDFSQITCNSCMSNSWSYHAYYYRYISIFSKRIRVRITRIICCTCGRTHAILIEPMIPYLSALFTDLTSLIIFSVLIFDSSLCAYYRKKFSTHISHYTDLVLFSSRNNSVIFITT